MHDNPHLHRFDDCDGITLRHPCALRHKEFPHVARDRAFNTRTACRDGIFLGLGDVFGMERVQSGSFPARPFGLECGFLGRFEGGDRGVIGGKAALFVGPVEGGFFDPDRIGPVRKGGAGFGKVMMIDRVKPDLVKVIQKPRLIAESFSAPPCVPDLYRAAEQLICRCLPEHGHPKYAQPWP